MYPAAESKAKVVYKEPLFVINDYFYDYFHKRSILHRNALLLQRMVVEFYNYEYEANDYGYKAKFEWYPKNTNSCNTEDGWLSSRSLSALSELCMLQNRSDNDKYSFFLWYKTIDHRSYTYSVTGFTCSRLPIRIQRPTNGLIFIKTEYLLLLVEFWNMFCLDYAKNFSPIIWGFTCSLLCIHTHPYSWKIYNHTLWLWFGCIPIRYFLLLVLLELKQS